MHARLQSHTQSTISYCLVEEDQITDKSLKNGNLLSANKIAMSHYIIQRYCLTASAINELTIKSIDVIKRPVSIPYNRQPNIKHVHFFFERVLHLMKAKMRISKHVTATYSVSHKSGLSNLNPPRAAPLSARSLDGPQGAKLRELIGILKNIDY